MSSSTEPMLPPEGRGLLHFVHATDNTRMVSYSVDVDAVSFTCPVLKKAYYDPQTLVFRYDDVAEHEFKPSVFADTIRYIDFVYRAEETEPTIAREDAVAVYSLSEKLGFDELEEKATSFLEDDIKSDPAALNVHLAAASYLEDNWRVMGIMFENTYPRLLDVSPEDDWVKERPGGLELLAKIGRAVDEGMGGERERMEKHKMCELVVSQCEYLVAENVNLHVGCLGEEVVMKFATIIDILSDKADIDPAHALSLALIAQRIDDTEIGEGYYFELYNFHNSFCEFQQLCIDSFGFGGNIMGPDQARIVNLLSHTSLVALIRQFEQQQGPLQQAQLRREQERLQPALIRQQQEQIRQQQEQIRQQQELIRQQQEQIRQQQDQLQQWMDLPRPEQQQVQLQQQSDVSDASDRAQ